jgi:hypothetical protein
MNWFELLYVCMKPVKQTTDPKCENIENVNVCITNERVTECSLNYSEGSLNNSGSCNSILSELSTIDEE